MKDLSIVDVPRVLKEKLNLLLLSENCWEVLCKKKIIKTFPNNYLSAYNNSAILRFQRAFPVMYKASLSCTVYTWRGRSSSANARILPFRILHFGNEVIFCFIICRAGDSNHSFINWLTKRNCCSRGTRGFVGVLSPVLACAKVSSTTRPRWTYW